MSWQIAMLILFAAIVLVCGVSIWITHALAVDVIHDEPWDDPRARQHQDFTVGRACK
jgi:hypothetical protein